MARLVVFDLDGTLIDSHRDLVESTNEMLESYGAAALPHAEVAMMIGEGAKRLVERARAAVGLDPTEPGALGRFRTIYDRRLLATTRPYDGIPEVLESAAGRAQLAVLSNKPEEPTRKLLEAFDLTRHFASVLGGDSAFPRKPDPSGLQHLMATADADQGSTLYVGDSMIDVETARRAGVRLCVAQYGFGHLRGDLVVPDDAWVAEAPPDVRGVIDRFLTT